VAIRYLADELSRSPEFMARLRSDLNRLGVIEQENLALAYELSEKDGRAALVTEFVDGPSLASLLRQQGPLPAVAAAFLAAEVLTGLAALHDQGILHRGVRTQAIQLGPHGAIKLTDIGLPALDAPNANLAPEVRRGEPESPA